MADEHRGLRLEDGGAVLPVDRGHGSADAPADQIPPSGHIAGVWARVDPQRGVHKAPANEVVPGANGLGFQITHAEQGELNRIGINCIRAFPGRGSGSGARGRCRAIPNGATSTSGGCSTSSPSRSWPARSGACSSPTTRRCGSSLTINVCELPQPGLAQRRPVRRKPGEAFYVKCDAETNPPEVIEAGQVVCEIGICPVKPAEFVIFRLSQFTGGGGAEVSE